MKTKLFLFSLIILLAISNISFSQSFTEKLSYEDFKIWALDQNLENYTFERTEKLPDEDFGNNEYYAVAFKPDDNTTNLMVTISEIHTFTDYLTMPIYKNQHTFEINGHTAVYLPNDADYSTSMLWVEMPELDANIMILKSPLRTKEELIGIFEALDFNDLIKD